MSCGAQVGPHSWCEARTASGGGGKGVETGPLRPKTEGEPVNRLLRFVVQDRVCSVAARAGDKNHTIAWQKSKTVVYLFLRRIRWRPLGGEKGKGAPLRQSTRWGRFARVERGRDFLFESAVTH